MTLSVAAIGALYASMGGRMYSGEPVTQLEHALQTAWLAERWAEDALKLRLWDDLAKVAGERTPDWLHFEAVLHRALI